ncbi:Calcium-dependent protein kinase 26 [Hibiscus syriacus]|uniref:Calcium-dependent protein kinase 26 n=1 Tax=Hibiscus syriacus TaxID=106335 RepID=A0A6A2WXX9_HIBSY|nr:Calcium-dependent protein kinase 26 [Hibiscus syriacus]
MFTAMDTDNSSAITFDELKAGCEDMADIDNSGTINYGEFIAATVQLNKLEREEHLVAAFRYFDKDRSGYITVDELQQACAEHNMTDVLLEDIIREVDQDNDGRIDYGEFVDMMKKGNGWIVRRTMRNSMNIVEQINKKKMSFAYLIKVPLLIGYLLTVTGKGEDISNYVFEDFQQLVEYTMLEMISVLREVKLSLSIAEAMRWLLMFNLNILMACEVEGDIFCNVGCKEILGENSSDSIPHSVHNKETLANGTSDEESAEISRPETVQAWITKVAFHVKSVDGNHLLEAGTSDPLGRMLNNSRTRNELGWEPKYRSFAHFLGVSE